MNGIAALVEQQRQPGASIDPKMMIALGADLQVLFQLFFPDDLAAALAFQKQSFRPYPLLFCRLNFAGFSFKPSQRKILSFLVLNPALGKHTLLVGMFDLLHLGHRVGNLYNGRMGIPPSQNYMHLFGLVRRRL